MRRCSRLRRWREAVADFSRAIHLRPEDWRLRYRRANAHAERFGHFFIRRRRLTKLNPNERMQDFKPRRVSGYGTFFL